MVRSFEAMLVAMALLAFFWSAALPLVEALTFDHLREDHTRYSRIRLWGSIGFIIAVMGTGALLDHVPLANLLWVIVGTLAGILACAMTVPEAPAHPAAGEQPCCAESCARRACARCLPPASRCRPRTARSTSSTRSILSDHHYSKVLVGSLWSLGVLAEIVVFFFMVPLLRRFGLRRVLLLSFAAAVLRFLMIGQLVDWPWLMVVAQLLHGLTFGAYHAAAVAAVNRWFPGHCQTRGQALYSTVSFGAGGLLGSLLSGWTWDAWGAEWTYSLGSLFALVGLLVLLGWWKDEGPAQAGAR
jgi:PPP family 3-phenylpropionic acid transporter